MPITQFYTLAKRLQTAYHNLCTEKQPPDGTARLLWHGLKFCVQKPLPKPQLDHTFDRLTLDIRRKYFWRDKAPNDEDYNPKLYIPSDWEPPEATPEIELAIQNFRTTITKQVQHNLLGQRRQHNLSTPTRKLLRELADNKDFIIIPTDKNLGPAILERSIYKKRCLDDHLNDKATYRRLTPAEATNRLAYSERAFTKLIEKHKNALPASDITYFTRCFKEHRRTPQFYCTPKVHKPIWKTRPIASSVNSRMSDLSKWVDSCLQKIVHLCPGYLKDSHSLLRKLAKLGKLPTSAVLVTADATSMYTNIDTTHGIHTLRKWLLLHAHELPDKYPVDMVIEATELVMRNNVFQFDDTHWLQLTGTAMGTSLACIYATIYYSYHEETVIIKRFTKNSNAPLTLTPVPLMPEPPSKAPLILHARLIDDAFQIFDAKHLPQGLTITTFVPYMTQIMRFGSLHWDVETPKKEVNFLDLTITLESDGTITTKTFVKPMNLHLYIPPQSAHPKGILKSLIFGNLQRYWIQNSNRADFLSTAGAFLGHLQNRGYDKETLITLFQEAATSIDNKAAKRATTHTEELWPAQQPRQDNRLFVHWEYHPLDIGRKAVRQAFNDTLAPTLTESGLKVTQLTIAFSVPKSLGQCLTKTQLEETAGNRVSSLLE